MEAAQERPKLFRRVPVAWSSPLPREAVIDALRRGDTRPDWLDFVSEGPHVSIRDDRVRIRWGSRSRRCFCVLDAQVKSSRHGVELTGEFRTPRAYLVVALFTSIVALLWAILVVAAVVDYGPRGIAMATPPAIFGAALWIWSRFASNRAVDEARSIDIFVRRALQAPRAR